MIHFSLSVVFTNRFSVTVVSIIRLVLLFRVDENDITCECRFLEEFIQVTFWLTIIRELLR